MAGDFIADRLCPRKKIVAGLFSTALSAGRRPQQSLRNTLAEFRNRVAAQRPADRQPRHARLATFRGRGAGDAPQGA